MDQNQQNKEQQKKEYQQIAAKHEEKRPIGINCLKAFVIGGLICTFGQAVQNFYMYFFDFTEKTAGDPTVATLIFIAILLTGFGVYRRFGQFAGAGSAVPVTGFANSMASAAIEFRTEGLVLGTGSNMFKLAGSVIVFGTVAAFVIALVRTLLGM
ncbi:stage V sporulation protein AC [Evansella sp. LMS18]|jgi:stage V sporulation protein AC|uniref:stage V sporulation protein AC n=1 Tax=Evansella sp. LMS18 TaxID=2924033 RepID=UPI0020D0EA63|nr:stage V sporulation protein AC [Evansella sp. LMS18]UTR09568.1 stage V sporulation protein AC [Evansella sp. LMS18]